MPHFQIQTTGLYRIGVVSKTTGIPISTLRVWEARYGAFSPVKTQGKQRLFEEHDIAKARLLKRLSQAGHAISAIANLDLSDLRRIDVAPAESPQKQSTFLERPISIAVVGMDLVNRLESDKFSIALQQQQISITNTWQDLVSARLCESTVPAQLLLVKVNSLQTSVGSAIQALVHQHGFSQTIVVYNFAPESVTQALKFAGVTLRREPISDSELAELLLSVLLVNNKRAQEFGKSGGVISARKYSDATLNRVARISSNMLCECPRHVTELIAQLASFEEYSQECLNKNAEDAHLHTYLCSVAGSARSLFENALEKVALHEGIDLREGRP